VIEITAVAGLAARTLIDLSAEAELLVVGSRATAVTARSVA
jgi:hypothetical protein